MILSKSITFTSLLQWSGFHIVWLLCGSALMTGLYRNELVDFSIPWLPFSVIGTAVAFYGGFKNSQSYESLWEARKICGGNVNDSRSWGMMVDTFISNPFTESDIDNTGIEDIKKNPFIDISVESMPNAVNFLCPPIGNTLVKLA